MSERKNEFRNNKKITKTNRRNAIKDKNFRMDDESILNSLPSGAFELKENKEVTISVNENDEKINEKVNEKDETNKKITFDLDEVDEEEFNESYFESTVYVKK